MKNLGGKSGAAAAVADDVAPAPSFSFASNTSWLWAAVGEEEAPPTASNHCSCQNTNVEFCSSRIKTDQRRRGSDRQAEPDSARCRISRAPPVLVAGDRR